MKTIWDNLPQPFFVQAPMEDVTDTVFRQIIGTVGAPDLYFTEFTNADGITKGSGDYVKQRLQFTKKERPLIAQIWGNDPDNYVTASKLLKKLGYDGIDINMGCPDRKVVKHGCCSGLIKNPKLARTLYEATVKGGGGLPVSIKTRIGYNTIVTDEWIGFLLQLKPAAITVHARTASEMSKVPAHWEEFEKVVKLRNMISPTTKIIANGDIETMDQGHELVKKYGVDGVMIGRGILHDPWVFQKNKKELSLRKRLITLKKHIALFDKTWGNKNSSLSGSKNFAIMKKFYKAYLHNFEGAQDIRTDLMQFSTAKDTLNRIEAILSSTP